MVEFTTFDGACVNIFYAPFSVLINHNEHGPNHKSDQTATALPFTSRVDNLPFADPI